MSDLYHSRVINQTNADRLHHEDIMSKYEEAFLELVDNGTFGMELVDNMKEQFGTRCLPLLIALCGDGDFYIHTLFSRFQIRSLVRATYNVKSSNYAIDPDFLEKLKDRAFWELNRKQMLKLTVELTFLYPDKFTFLKRWEEQYHQIGTA